MGTSVPPVQRIPSQLLAALTTRSFSSKHWAVLGTGSKEGEINFSASTCCRQTHVHPVTPGRSHRDFFFSYHASQAGQVLSRCKPEELIISAGAWGFGPPPAAVRGHITTSTYTLLTNFMGFPCLSACNSLIYSTMLLHKLMMTGNSSGLDSPSLFGKGEKQQIRKVKRGSASRQDTCISPQQTLAENLTKTIQAH